MFSNRRLGSPKIQLCRWLCAWLHARRTFGAGAQDTGEHFIEQLLSSYCKYRISWGKSLQIAGVTIIAEAEGFSFYQFRQLTLEDIRAGAKIFQVKALHSLVVWKILDTFLGKFSTLVQSHSRGESTDSFHDFLQVNKTISQPKSGGQCQVSMCHTDFKSLSKKLFLSMLLIQVPFSPFYPSWRSQSGNFARNFWRRVGSFRQHRELSHLAWHGGILQGTSPNLLWRQKQLDCDSEHSRGAVVLLYGTLFTITILL